MHLDQVRQLAAVEEWGAVDGQVASPQRLAVRALRPRWHLKDDPEHAREPVAPRGFATLHPPPLGGRWLISGQADRSGVKAGDVEPDRVGQGVPLLRFSGN